MNPVLSILTPSVPKRAFHLANLCEELATQIGSSAVEHLVFQDNKKRTVGEKRDALLRISRGQYVAFMDDDDWISSDYVEEILKAAKDGSDVITFKQHATVNAQISIIEFKLGSENEQFNPNGVTKRNAWHVCAWKRSLAVQSRFPAKNYGEDWEFSAPLCKAARTETHIPKTLHFYRHSSETTEAPPGS